MNRHQMLGSLLASVIFIAFAAWPAYSWHGSGDITTVAIDPVTSTTLFAATHHDGVFKSIDGGTTWTRTALTDMYVGALAIDPTTPSTVYAATWPGGVYKTTDAGGTWRAVNVGLANLNVSSVSVDALGFVYAVLWDRGVFKSTDGAETWNAILRTEWLVYYTATGRVFNPTLGAFAVDRRNPAHLYVSTQYETTWEDDPLRFWGQLLKSTDGGASWGGTTLDSMVLGYSIFPYPVMIDSASSQTPSPIYAGVNSALLKSTDEGTSWIEWLACGATDVAVDPLVPTTLYAICAGVIKTVDGGATWSVVGSGVADVLRAFGLDPLLRTLAIDPQNPNNLYLGTVGGVFKSSDGGGFWSPTGLFQHSPLASLSLDPSIVVSGSTSTGTVSLATPAPAGGVTVMLASENPSAAIVPASVTVPAGATSATFVVSTNWSGSGWTAFNISASVDGATRSAWFRIGPATIASALSIAPSSLPGGDSATATVTLNTAASAGAAVVALSSSNPAVANVPATVSVPAGTSAATFTVSTSSVPVATSVTISGTYGGATRSAALTVTPLIALSAVSLNPASVTAGSASTGTVLLTAPAPPGGTAVTLSSSNPSIATVPASVTVPAGAISATFAASTPACASGSVTISAAYAGEQSSRSERSDDARHGGDPNGRLLYQQATAKRRGHGQHSHRDAPRLCGVDGRIHRDIAKCRRRPI